MNPRRRRRSPGPLSSLLGVALLTACGPRPPATVADLGAPIDLAPAFVGAAHLPFPQVPGAGASLLAPLTLITIVPANESSGDDLLDFSDALVASDWWKAVGADYGLGAAAASIRVSGPALPPGAMGNRALITYISAAVSAGPGFGPAGTTLYLLYVPEGVTLYSGDILNTNCAYLGGYHSAFDGGGNGFAVVQHCAPPDGRTTLDEQTLVGSHEVLEAATDTTSLAGFNLGVALAAGPWGRSVWQGYEAPGSHAEVGDLCEGTQVREGRFLYQRIWSNSGARAGGDPCAPAVAAPYFNASPAQEWLTVAAGGSIDIPVTGFSTAPTADWLLAARVRQRSAPTLEFGARITAPARALIAGGLHPALNDGETATLTVTAPADAPVGSWVIALVYSQRLDDTGAPIPDSDVDHFWPIGVHVQ